MQAILNKWRVILLVFAFFTISGLLAINQIPKEETPDVSLPNIYVSINLDGITAEDSDKLLIQPLQKHLSTVSGVKKIKAVASPGHGSFDIEFNSDVEIGQALTDVQRAVDKGEKELPQEADKPNVTEINLSLFPIITLSISGDQNEAVLLKTAKFLQDAIESLPLVLEAEIKGSRDEVLEIIINPEMVNALNLDLAIVLQQVRNNNQLVAAGAIDNGSGRFNLKIPGLIDTAEKLSELPIRYNELKTIKLKDIANIQLGFEQANSIAYMDGKRAILLQIKKRLGANLIKTVQTVRETVNQVQDAVADGVYLKFSLDSSKNILSSLSDLLNNIVFATILVMIVVLIAIGTRNSILVGLAIPGSFLSALFVLNTIGFTLNIVVLFALILSVGLLVDSAIVITESSDRYLSLGKSRIEAYVKAVKELGLPVISSTITTLSVFLPLLFWPGLIGQFMFYLPSTLIIVLSSALLISLLVIPSFGLILPYKYQKTDLTQKNESLAKQKLTNTYLIQQNRLDELKGFVSFYYRIVSKVIRWPFMTLFITLGIFIAIFVAYSKFNAGTIFFPKIEPENGYLQVKARNNLSINERKEIAILFNNRLLEMGELENIYAEAQTRNRNNRDLIAQINYEFVNWTNRRSAEEINQHIKERVADIPGVISEVGVQESGPPKGDSDINILIQSSNKQAAKTVAEDLKAMMRRTKGLIDIEDDYSETDREWELVIDREKAAEFDLSIAESARYARMVTSGVKVGDFHTDLSNDSIDIKIIYPEKLRSLNQLNQIKIAKNGELIPLSSFATFNSVNATGEIKRTDGAYSYRVFANTDTGFNTNQMIAQVIESFDQLNIPNEVLISFEGEAEQQAETSAFLVKAFATAIFIMFLVLMLQFNSFYHSFLVLSAIIFSTGGVLMGFMLTNEPFVIVMGGIGIISLAGVVVNNNIILISSYNYFKKEGLVPIDAIIKTCLTRLRPVLLTAFTTVLGLIPMVYQININLLEQDVLFNSPSSQWWVALSTTIAGGLSIATLITLLFIPAMLALGESAANFENPFKLNKSKLIKENQSSPI